MRHNIFRRVFIASLFTCVTCSRITIIRSLPVDSEIDPLGFDLHDNSMVAGVLLDLSGVIYVGSEPLPGALEAVSRLRNIGLPLRFLTNTTRTPKRQILTNLHAMGLECGEDELFTPAQAARDWLAAHKCKPNLLIHPNLQEDFEGLAEFPGTAVVVGDAGEGFTFRALNTAFRTLVGGAEFIALAANRTFKDHDGELSLDAGAFVTALEFGSGKTATVLGKPAPEFFGGALESMNVKAEEAVMIGDDAEADVSGAIAAGIGAGLLVRTGKYVEGAESLVNPPPTATVDDIVKAVDWIEEKVAVPGL
ncbi:MAG: TIGR01458 family HAD-type hydrolase [Hyphomicrobiales bacterium]